MIAGFAKTILESVERTATPAAQRFTNLGYRGCIITVHCTAVTATPLITPEMRVPNAAGVMTAHAVWTAAAAIAGTGAYEYLLYPGAAGGNFTEVDGIPLPADFDLVFTHADADAATYDATIQFLP